MKTYTTEQITKAIEFGTQLLNEAGFNTAGFQEYWYTSNISEWEKEEKHNLYVNMKYGRTYNGSRKWTRGCKMCINLNTLSYRDVSQDYNNANERHTMEQIAVQIIDFLKYI